jgi:glycine/D-amino acid oxidase-like deaminating enzyme
MRVAVIGAGMAALAAAWELLRVGSQVELYAGEGAGASGIAAGLMHPYPGEAARRIRFASEGMAATNHLLKVAEQALGQAVAIYAPLIRIPFDEEQRLALTARAGEFADLIPTENGNFLITSGVTVQMPLYLQGLQLACEQRGAIFRSEQVTDLSSLGGYDGVVVAAGAGIRDFPECAPVLKKVKFNQGQVLVCRSSVPLVQSIVGKGFLAATPDPTLCTLGSTYERDLDSEGVNLERAKAELLPRAKILFAESELTVLECRAAMRVAPINHLPIIEELKPGLYVFTGLGSRGLIYHALFAKRLVDEISRGRITC